jgi:hypothetical protein
LNNSAPAAPSTTSINFPISDAQVDDFNLYQLLGISGQLHAPVICPNVDDGSHINIAVAPGILIANRQMIVCPCCHHTQRWAPAHSLAPQPPTEGPLDDPEYPEMVLKLKRLVKALDASQETGITLGMNVLSKSLRGRLATLADRFQVNGPKVEMMPAMLLVELHNMAERDSPVRRTIRGFIAAENVRRERQHWMGALLENDDGDLLFDDARYEQTVWRGKQETYYKGVKEHFEKMHGDLKFVSRFQQLEDAPLLSLDNGTRPLLPVRELDPGVVGLKALQKQVQGLLGMMEGGAIASMLISLDQRDVDSQP